MKNFIILTSVFISVLFLSCKKSGCNDPLATNFDEFAELDDGSCSYSADLVFFLNQARYQDYLNNSGFYAPFHFFVDGTEIGELSISNAAFETHETPPPCSDLNGPLSNGVFNYSHEMSEKTGSVKIDIEDQLENSHGSITVAIEAGNCSAVLL